jgi:16S rRNA (uracil1498-N3)-methyltransferase
MEFLFLEEAGKNEIFLKNEKYRHIFMSRRTNISENIRIRNLKDGFLYIYEIGEIKKNRARLFLREKIKKRVEPKRFLHLLWAIIEPKTIQKTLPALNEIGVSKITFFYSRRSQRNFILKKERLEKILQASCGQCGRSSLMEIEFLSSIEDVVKKYKDFFVLDFNEKTFNSSDNIWQVMIGCEGGFDESERKLLEPYKKISFDTSNVLKSETAAVSLASKILL